MPVRQMAKVAAAAVLIWNLQGATPAISQNNPAEPTLVGQFGAWGAYVAAPNGQKRCFALSRPTSAVTNPPDRPRDPIYAFISTRPGDKVKDEVYITVGYPLSTTAPASIEVGGDRFDMYAEGDGLWVRNAAEEPRLVEVLRKGAEAVVKGVSTRGTQTTDVYSLRGVMQALDRVAQECR